LPSLTRNRYTIAWKRTATDIALDNAVEYKSLPSGLHSLDSDLVYFTHDGYAGLSAFARGNAGAEERNANFVSVGILARRDGEFGRLGRGWLLAGRLEKMAASLAEDPEAVAPLEAFWEEQTARPHGEASTNPKGHSRVRAISTVSAVTKDDERLPAYHPALAMLQYIDVFGPLVFRLQQAALLRKRILFVGSPPVRAMCEFGMSRSHTRLGSSNTHSLHPLDPLQPLPARLGAPHPRHRIAPAPAHPLLRRRARYPLPRGPQSRSPHARQRDS
jgi:hypothetical protein